MVVVHGYVTTASVTSLSYRLTFAKNPIDCINCNVTHQLLKSSFQELTWFGFLNHDEQEVDLTEKPSTLYACTV